MDMPQHLDQKSFVQFFGGNRFGENELSSVWRHVYAKHFCAVKISNHALLAWMSEALTRAAKQLLCGEHLISFIDSYLEKLVYPCPARPEKLLKEKERLQVLKEMEDLVDQNNPFNKLPKLNSEDLANESQCYLCGSNYTNNIVTGTIVQLRSADEPSNILYTCKHPSHGDTPHTWMR